MRDYDYSIQTYSDLCDTVVTADAARQSSVDYLMDKMISIEIQQDDLQKEHDKLQKQQNQAAEKIVDLQWRSMRENLIFSGIKEPKLPRGMYENVEMSLRTFLREEMNIERDIPFDRVHRLGKYDPEQKYPRPIVAKFEKFRDKEFVRKSAPATLRGKTFGVNEQFPVEIENKRKLLYPEAKKARQDSDNKVRMVKDKLYVNKVLVTVEKVDENGTQDDINNETSRKQNYPTEDHSNAAKPKTRIVYNYQRGQGSRGQWRGRWRGRGLGRGYNANRDDSWSTQPVTSQRDNYSDQRHSVAWSIPISNHYSPLVNINDETPRAKAPGKRQATSPVDSDITVKKYAENNSNREPNEIPASEVHGPTETNNDDQTENITDTTENGPPPASGHSEESAKQPEQSEQSEQTMEAIPSENRD